MNTGEATESRAGGFPDASTVAAALGLAALYFCAGKFGLSLASVNASASAVWPPTGLALAALLLWGTRLWPAVFLAAFLVNLTTQGSWATSLGIATGNTLEAVLAAAAVRRFAGGAQVFESVQNIFKYVLLAALLSTGVSATVGVTSLCLGGFAGWDHFGSIWLTWWLGDLISGLMLTPLLVIWKTRGLFRWTLHQGLEALSLLVLVLGISYLLFSTSDSGSTNGHPLEYLAIPPLLWAALRFDQRGAATCALLISAVALWGTRHGLGPFVRTEPNESLLLLQTFMGTITLTALLAAALMAERNQLEVIARQTEAQKAALLEQKVQERTARLRELVAELEHFSYALVHDMRAPLRAMQGFAALIEEQLPQTARPELLDYLERIRTSAIRLDALVRDALVYTEAVRQHPPLQPVDLAELLPALLKSYPELQPPNAEVRLEGPLPVVLGNVSGLTQCFSNLLGNAVKFVAPGVTPRVRVWAEPLRNADCALRNEASEPDATIRNPHSAIVRVWVEDNGIGIPPEWHARIFDMFQRASPGYEGTGIGLAIVRKVTERMAGRAGLESAPNHGSRFWVELMVAPGPTAP